MYIQEFKRNNKGIISTSTLLVESYRENGKQKRRTIANLSKVPPHYIASFKKVIKGGVVQSLESLPIGQGKSFGALFVLNKIAQQIGISKVLGSTKMGKLAMLQVLNKIICPCSRLAIHESWSSYQAIEEVLKINSFSLDDLYQNLTWLGDNQQKIEDKLFATQKKKATTVYLYDVTSSYLEGQQNELANYGYNRDGKKGKKQIVIGLLTDANGDPFSVEVFEGNTNDTKTFGSQLEKMRDRFKLSNICCVGDKGMIKSAQIDLVKDFDYNYITSITKAQIVSLAKQGTIQLSLFDKDLIEVTQGDIRYILRRNDTRKAEIENTRNQKLEKIQKAIKTRNQYLKEHSKAKVETAIKNIEQQIVKLKVGHFASCQHQDRELTLVIEKEKLQEISLLDGCYVIKTNLCSEHATKEQVHSRYKDLAKVEFAFKTLKTTLIELRPIFLRKEKRTRGHVFACMLAYKIVKAMMDKFPAESTFTKDHIIGALDKIQYTHYQYNGISVKRLPDKFLDDQEMILKTLDIKLPKYVTQVR